VADISAGQSAEQTQAINAVIFLGRRFWLIV
jgi:hypothetical protein